jgi:SAM-dependent methyltransferase/uncharacterized protein YbaR (Trm112 family)
MRHSTIELLRCPACDAENSLGLLAEKANSREVRSGELACRECGHRYPVAEGVADLLFEPPEHVRVEAAGLKRFADVMSSDGWDREKILQLPDIEDPYWYVQRSGMDAVLEAFDFAPGDRIVDVGSNTCWASSTFAELGLEVFSLDITTTMMQGLHTAEWWMDEKDVFFERLLGSMFKIPIASNTVDYVFCCEVLHHNDAAELPKTLAEIFRVLKPGGKAIVINEPLKTLRDRVGNHAEETGASQFEGYEHAYYAHEYLGAARDAGFRTKLIPPPHLGFFHDRYTVIDRQKSALWGIAMGMRHVLRRLRLGRWAYLQWKIRIAPSSSISFVGTKPSEQAHQ